MPPTAASFGALNLRAGTDAHGVAVVRPARRQARAEKPRAMADTPAVGNRASISYQARNASITELKAAIWRDD